MAVKVEKRFFSDIDTTSGISPLTRKMLEGNPFADKATDAIQLVGVEDGAVTGGEAIFPLRIKAKGVEYKVIGGAELWVDENHRKSMLGVMLPDAICRASPSKAIVGAAASQMALPVYRMLRYKIFLLPRYIALWKSRAVVEMKIKGILAKIASGLIDACISVYAFVLSCLVAFKLRGLIIREVASIDEKQLQEIANLIAADKKPYCEIHDTNWIRWHFAVCDGTKLYAVRDKGVLVGTFMTLKQFHAQASHRGFKNVWLGSILEWQCNEAMPEKLKWMLAKASLLLQKQGVDAVDVPSADVGLQRFFARIGWRQVGESNFVYKVLKDSPLYGDEDMSKIENWRIRPAMSDVGLG